MATLRVSVLGPLEVEGVRLECLRSRQARLLLKVLAVMRGQPVSVDRLMEIIWGHGEVPANFTKQLSVTVSRARHVLGPDAIQRTEEGYRLLVEWLDLDELEALAVEAHHRLSMGASREALAAALAGLSLVRGPLLGDVPDDWCVIARTATERLVSDCRRIAAEAALAVGDSANVVTQAHLLLEADPYDEAGLRLLMAGYLADGRPASAIAAYGRARERLANDLGVDPNSATQAVYEAALRDQPLPGQEPLSLPTLALPALPGRADELAALERALATALGRVTIVVVTGEAGAGKTRLVEVWGSHLASRGIPVLAGQCEEIGRSLPLQPVADALAAHLYQMEPGETQALIGEDVDLLTPLLGFRVGRVAQRPAPAPASHEAARALIFGSVLGLIDRLPGLQPKVLVLEDCHLAGSSTIEWLHFAARRRSQAGLLIVATLRPDEGVTLPGVQLPLPPLDLTAVAELVGPESAPDLLRRSGGNPLFLVQLAAAEHGLIPQTLIGAVALRCARLGADCMTVLRICAVLGDPIDVDSVAAVSDIQHVEVLNHLEKALKIHLLQERSGQFVFEHEVVREALAADVSAGRRAWLHRQAAITLLGQADVNPLLVASHAEMGGDKRLAAAALVSAAERVSERLDPAEAERLLDRSIALRDTAEARLGRAQVRVHRQRFAAAAQDAQAARQLGAGAPALEIQAWAARYGGEVQQSLQLAKEAVRLADGQAERMSALTVAGATLHLLGRLPDAERYLEEAVAAEARSDVGPSLWLAWLRIHQGRSQEALDLAQRVLCSPGSALSYSFPLEHALVFKADALVTLGRVTEAMDVLDRVTAETRRRETWQRFGGTVHTLRARVLRSLGLTQRADMLDTHALADHWLSPVSSTWGIAGLADGRIRAGDFEGAVRYLDRMSNARSQPYLHWHSRFDEQLLRARLALLKGDHVTARRQAADLAANATELGALRHATLARLALAQARARNGDPANYDEVERDLAELPAVAGLDAWWLTADLANDYPVDRWWQLAEARLAELLDASGTYRHQLHQYASGRLAAHAPSATLSWLRTV